MELIHTKRFLLFTGEEYYPQGGALDFKSSFATLEKAIEAFSQYLQDGSEWANIFDTESETIVKVFEYGEWKDDYT